MKHFSLERRLFTEHHLTCVAEGDRPVSGAAAVFSELAATLVELGVTPFSERVRGPASARDEVLRARKAQYAKRGLDTSLPYAYVDGRDIEPAEGGGPIAVQLCGVTAAEGSGVSVETAELTQLLRGRLMTGPGVELLWVPGVTGADDEGTLPASPVAQAERMFAAAESALASRGFAYTDVVRTWIASRHLLDWYDELNRVRTAFHRERGITGGPDGLPFPASTGIQGTSGGEECLMEVLAVRGEALTAAPAIRSSRQDEPIAYGSGFSRGMSLVGDGGRTVLVSGTASVGPDGQTRHVGDREAQAVETLLGVAALLEPVGCRLCDICSGTLFYKDLDARQAFERVARWLGLAELPLVPVLADVCRPELLVEIEAIALVAE